MGFGNSRGQAVYFPESISRVFCSLWSTLTKSSTLSLTSPNSVISDLLATKLSLSKLLFVPIVITGFSIDSNWIAKTYTSYTIMPWQSPFNSLNIPQVDILTYLLQGDVNLTDYPIWFDAENPSQCLTMAQALELASRVAAGLDRLEVPPGDVVLTLSPNSISIPPLYLGIVGSGRIFSGASPSYTVSGRNMLPGQPITG